LSAERRRHEVIVVGAGFTGLCAATELVAQGIDAIVLEARDRVGGRVESAFNELGERLDTGGQFLCEDMPELMRLARQFGKTLVETPTAGDFIVQPSLPKATRQRVYQETVAIRERMDALEPGDPAIADLNVAGWLDRQDNGADAKSAFQSLIEGMWCQAMDRIPMWHLVDNDRRITNEVSELQYFLGETLHSLADDMARNLGSRLLLGMPVTDVSHGSNGVLVMAGGQSFEGERAIVAVPPVMASRIAYAPALPEPLSRTLGAWESGAVIKVKLRYARAFWRDHGLSGTVMWRNPHGMFVCDTSDMEHPALVVFVAGPLARRWSALGVEGIHRELTARLTVALGPEAQKFIAATFRDWTDDRWSGGGYSDLVLDLDARDAEALLREGAGVLQFASSELSPSFPGYVEGAVVVGRIAARNAAAALRNIHS
jgi:monoamine oxidase